MSPNQAQPQAWNGGESVHHVDHVDRYDRQLAPVTEALLARAATAPRDTVLDVGCGCGCGAMTLAAARSAHWAVGVDISEPLVRAAADRAHSAGLTNVELVVADPQTRPAGSLRARTAPRARCRRAAGGRCLARKREH